MQHKIPICFYESPARRPRQCERDLICNSKRSGWKKFIFEHWNDRLMFELSDELTTMAILGSARGSRVGFGPSPKRSDCGSSRVGLKVRDRQHARPRALPQPRYNPAE